MFSCLLTENLLLENNLLEIDFLLTFENTQLLITFNCKVNIPPISCLIYLVTEKRYNFLGPPFVESVNYHLDHRYHLRFTTRLKIVQVCFGGAIKILVYNLWFIVCQSVS